MAQPIIHAMPPAVLYLATAVVLLLVAHRFIARIPLAVALVLVLLPLCITGDAVLTGRLLAPVDFVYQWEPFAAYRAEFGVREIRSGHFSDIASQMLPWRASVREALARGEWPLLNRSILAGDILAAAAQPAVYSPFTLLACLLPAAESFTFTAAITLFVAALGAYLFAAEVGCGLIASLTAAAGWMFTGSITFFAMWPLGFAWSLLPFVLLATRRVVATPNLRHTLLLVVALSLLIVAGHPETVVHVVLVGVFYGTFELVRASNRGRVIAHVAAAGTAALLLCAIFVLPFLEAVEQTVQYRIRRDYLAKAPIVSERRTIIARAGAMLVPFLEDHDGPARRIWKLHPGSATGGLVLALAAYSLARVRRREVMFFAALAVFCGLAGFEAPPVAQFLHFFPVLNVALNGRLVFGAGFALTILAAIGMEELIARRGDRRAGVIISGVFLMLSAITAWLLVIVPGHSSFRVSADLIPLAIAAATLMAAPRWRHGPLLILVLLVVQRSATEAALYPTHPAQIAYPRLPVLEPLRDVPRPFRVVGGHLALVPNTAAMYGLEDARGYEAMTFRRLEETYPLWSQPVHMWFNAVGDLDRPFLSMMNVRFAITPTWMPVPAGWVEILTDHGTRLLENTRVLPRAFVPKSVRRGAGDPVAEMAAETDFSQRAWIEGPHEWTERPNGPGEVVEIHDAPNGYALVADMKGDGWVIITQSAWKGWRISIDGRRARYEYGNHAFLAVLVPFGRHELRLTYMPQSFVIGRAISILTVAVLALTAIVRRRRPKRPE